VWLPYVRPWPGLKKRELLEKGLVVVAQTNRAMQRLVSEYKGELAEVVKA
jgi:hypothetical protein